MTLANPSRLPRTAGTIANASLTPTARAVTQAEEKKKRIVMIHEADVPKRMLQYVINLELVSNIDNVTK